MKGCDSVLKRKIPSLNTVLSFKLYPARDTLRGKWEGAPQRGGLVLVTAFQGGPGEAREVAGRHSTFVPLFFCLCPGPTIHRQLSLNTAPVSQLWWDPVETELGRGVGGGERGMMCVRGWEPSLGEAALGHHSI